MKTKDRLRVCGIMSGTSLDGVDVAIVDFEEQDGNIDFELIHFSTVPYSNQLSERLRSIVQPNSQSPEISSMNMLLGEVFANAVSDTLQECGLSFDNVDLISSHGQTVFHDPLTHEDDSLYRPNTLQIGDISVIAEKTGIPTIGDFRTRDIAVGGQGAPLVPFVDYTLLRSEEEGRILVNIGGISNLTVLKEACQPDDVIAYDTGPGNMLIDAFMNWYTNGKQTFDPGGQYASEGKVHTEWLNELLNHPYYAKLPPKSTGREQFGIEYAEQLWKEAEAKGIKEIDRISTITELTVQTLARSLRTHIEIDGVESIYISGGGWNNRHLMGSLEKQLPENITVHSTQELGMNNDAKEAIVFALLGYLGFNKKTNNLPSATGAKKRVVMGKISW